MMKILEESMIQYKTKYPEIEYARYVSRYKIQLIFKDDVERIIDFEEFLKTSHHPSIKMSLKFELFKSFKIVEGNLNWNDYDLIFPLAD